MKVIFIRSDGTAEKTIDISPDSKLSENREEVQMLLGLPANQPYNLILERTGRKLKDSLTFEAAGVQDDDKLILCSPDDPEPKPPKEVKEVTSSPAEKIPINDSSSSSKPISKVSNSNNRLMVLIAGTIIGVAILLAIVINSLFNNSEQTQPSSTTPSTSPENTSETNATVGGEPGKKNIRSGPSTDYPVVGEISTGSRITIVSKGKEDQGGYIWYEIYDPFSKTKGWMTEQLIYFDFNKNSLNKDEDLF